MLFDCLKSNTVLLQYSSKKSPAELIHHPLPPLLPPPGSAAARCWSACEHCCVKDCNQYRKDARWDGTDFCCRAPCAGRLCWTFYSAHVTTPLTGLFSKNEQVFSEKLSTQNLFLSCFFSFRVPLPYLERLERRQAVM